MEKIGNKKEFEKNIVRKMIYIYCKKKHNSENELCSECEDLILYSYSRVDNCPHTQSKTFCSFCDTSCYREDYKEKIKAVMRFSGPRMLYHNPIITIKHLIYSKLFH
ncbi:nitrous oxide-stimulated promoter family protein [Tissierella carlieri]|jgi:hypothetical protein|uniref:nitrous oxide-stimulated promoter family protein n=1 Tax=Tissierella carlieri TaxID=689904 RepID=UPI001C11F927|nr:nitrous oxide-stimulated promoter family protein [Tissierella carlieri]MBU5312099.1 nitrous oxide-stimulated promoter family protein [Tissierella carlieri]MDU5080981.1 nitrous oxide-stimulated promoter family protein [Bacillota bacterium]